ncbi:hypothetical protein BFP72_08365 [Reichenbachiella sp. 5M10]|uniref:heavy metal translocating P-type ATPase n=1 Tax=Reichenbachiella sp. 5M10 TaxID=1889772 RepID=UPI000C149F83|nr:heavy metal translocating P-type ATPase metal-binding domain-containing protein [Reichenbachiella sp. 5M10]PIB35407.1 hypothetical protein BFP72_08365 [Reichenbachiella sp. 5M10]
MQITDNVKCFHCGEDCKDSTLHLAEKHFCCLGCQTVFQLLEENDLCEYYELEHNPGNPLKDFFANKYNFLENEIIVDQLLDFKSNDYHKITLDIPTIHCSSCIWLLENLRRFDEHIIHSRIQFSTKQLTIDYHPTGTTLKAIVELLCQLGYEPEITLETRDKDKKPSTSKNNLIKLGIAGFTFGNIMLFSFPEYFGMAISSDFVHYFGYLNLLLSLPVLYCAQEFFVSAYRGLQKRILNIDLPIAIGILALFVRSSYEILSQSGAGYFDSMAALVLLLLIGRWFQGQTYRQLSFDRNYKSYFPLAVYRIEQGQKKSVLVEELQAGDKIEIRNEEIVPCDAILNAASTQIDYSFVTGESLPIAVSEGEKIYAGGRIKGPAVQMNILQAVSHSYLTQLWNNDVFSKPHVKEERLLINRVSRYFTPAILLLAISAGIFWMFIDSSKALNVFSSVLIIACPCALALASPFALGTVLNVLSRHKFYIKNTQALEKIWHIKHLVFDKTGTITNNHQSNISFEGLPLSHEEKSWVLSLVTHSTHPLSQSICQLLSDNSRHDVRDFAERKGKGLEGKVSNHLIQIGSADLLGIKTKHIPTQSRVYLGIDGILRGYFSIQGAYRKGLQSAIDQLKDSFQFTILSGDNSAERESLEDLFPKGTQIHFGQNPLDKLEKIKSIESTHPCMMIGDGLNDAGALKASSVGISISDNLSSFTPASDGILLGNHLPQLAGYLHFITQSRTVIILAILLSFAYNIVGLSFAVLGWVTPVFAALLMPISSITVVAFVTLTIKWLGSRLL